jgi:hypothetical protein
MWAGARSDTLLVGPGIPRGRNTDTMRSDTTTTGGDFANPTSNQMDTNQLLEWTPTPTLSLASSEPPHEHQLRPER